MLRHLILLLTAIGTLATSGSLIAAEPPRALAPKQLPDDRRLGELRTLNDYFPFSQVDSPEAWTQRARALRRQVLVATGLWPMPTRTPLEAVIHGRVEREDYTVEKVYFQSFPGHYVTGNLYRPKDRSGPLAGVLCPHGHWADGRFHDHGAKGVREQIAEGGERFEAGGRHPLQARCVQLARMGCVVFHYDMVGYADSVQLNHRPGVRETMNTPDGWGFFSPQAELRLQNMMGLQTYNSIRALDFLAALPDVDEKRIAVTGASGGGTQTFMLCAVDDRPAVAFPAVMVSTAMQGGCTCENAPYLRIGAGNIDLAALTCPRPLGMTAANDWTKEIATKGLPDLQRLYGLFNIKDHVAATPLVHFGHNYNSVSRTAMYHWLNQHLDLGHDVPVIEREYLPLSRDEMSVWNDTHPRPSGEQAGDAHERALVRWMTDDADEQLQRLLPAGPAELDAYRETIGGAWRVLIQRTLDDVGKTEFELTAKHDRGDYLLMAGLVKATKHQEQLPALFLHPKSDWNRQVVLWIADTGKSDLFSPDGEIQPAIAQLLDAGYSVVGVDLVYQGEFLVDEGAPPAKTRLVAAADRQPWKNFAGYTFGYNHPLFAQRVHDILTIIHFASHDEHQPESIHLVGLGSTAGPLAAAAAALSGDAIGKTAIDTAGFRFASLDRVDHPMFVPGAAKYHDVAGLLALSAPRELWLAGEPSGESAAVRAAFHAAEASEKLTQYDGDEQGKAMAVVEWLAEAR